MYNSLDIARYIINHLNEENSSVSNLKLQKLLYFVQGFFLAIKDEPCFNDRIEAWDFGPVVPNAYHEFKEFGSNGIPMIKTYFKFNSDNFWDSETVEFDDKVINDNDKELINAVLDLYKNYSATALVRLTHNQDPWSNTYDQGCKNLIISNESIKEYFKRKYLG